MRHHVIRALVFMTTYVILHICWGFELLRAELAKDVGGDGSLGAFLFFLMAGPRTGLELFLGFALIAALGAMRPSLESGTEAIRAGSAALLTYALLWVGLWTHTYAPELIANLENSYFGENLPLNLPWGPVLLGVTAG